jgi:hypothetical protein
MPALATALAVGAGVKAAYSYGKGRGWWGAQPPKQKISEEEKRRAAELERITREGRYSPATLAALRNKALQGAYGAAERGASNINQNLSRRGFEGSAIGAEAVKPLYAGAVNKAGEVSSDLAIENEDSKLEAFNQLGVYGERKSQVAYGNAMAKYQHKTENYDAAVGSLVDADVGLYGAYAQGKSGFNLESFGTGQFDPQSGDPQYNTDQLWEYMMKNPEEAKQLLPLLSARGII